MACQGSPRDGPPLAQGAAATASRAPVRGRVRGARPGTSRWERSGVLHSGPSHNDPSHPLRSFPGQSRHARLSAGGGGWGRTPLTACGEAALLASIYLPDSSPVRMTLLEEKEGRWERRRRCRWCPRRRPAVERERQKKIQLESNPDARRRRPARREGRDAAARTQARSSTLPHARSFKRGVRAPAAQPRGTLPRHRSPRPPAPPAVSTPPLPA